MPPRARPPHPLPGVSERAGDAVANARERADVAAGRLRQAYTRAAGAHDRAAAAHEWLADRYADDGLGEYHRRRAAQHRLDAAFDRKASDAVGEPFPSSNDDDGIDAEVERLIKLGSRHVDVGADRARGFVVLADPEDNEFCVLRRLVGHPTRHRGALPHRPVHAFLR